MTTPKNKRLGRLCKNGHEWGDTGKTLRWIKSRHCVICEKERGQSKERKIYSHDWQQQNKEKRKTIDSRSYLKNITERRLSSLEYYRKHKNERLQYERKIYRNDYKKRITKSISTKIYKLLKNNKMNLHWHELVEFNASELIEHLEKQFTPGMSWDNYGEWHIDHIIPIAVWNYTSAEDKEFKLCWSLSNLQPLWASDNQSKGKKVREA